MLVTTDGARGADTFDAGQFLDEGHDIRRRDT